MAIPCLPQYVVTPVTMHGQIECQSWPYISPIEWLEKLMIDHRDALVPSPSEIKDFWRTWFKDHPLDEFHDDKSYRYNCGGMRVP